MSFSFLSSVGSLVFHDSTLCSNFLRIDRISDSSVTADESCRARRVRSRTIAQIENRANTAKSTSHDFGSKEFWDTLFTTSRIQETKSSICSIAPPALLDGFEVFAIV